MLLNILRLKYHILNNHIIDIKKHVYFHMLVGFGILFVLVFGGTGFFYFLFKFLMSQEVFGPLLMDMLIGMVFLAFFSMLIFSNLIITLTTAYISKETDFFISLPIKFKDIFLVKFAESAIYSSWAFAILSLPFFIAFAQSRDLNMVFYPMVILLLIPFVLIPAGIGAFITMIISALFPARHTRLLSIVLAFVAIAFSILMVRLMGFKSFVSVSQEEQFSQIMAFLNIGSVPILPNFWLTKGVLAAAAFAAKNITLSAAKPFLLTYLYWLAMLLSTALMMVQISIWLIKPLFYKGWALSRESASKTTTKASGKIFNFIEKLMPFFSTQTKTLISKDLKTFWRDPAQWTQLVILFGLLFIYIANLKNVAFQSGGFINLTFPKWKMILSFFNLSATCFIISILSTRFVYPMLSLEGKQFWIIGLAPLKREKVVWQKYWLCLLTSLVISEFLIIYSNKVLDVSLFIFSFSVISIFIMSFGLTSLAVGLGAMTPNFKEDNPARIANGLGGTLNVILSMLYIGGAVMLGVYPTTLLLFEKLNPQAIFSSVHTKWLLLNFIGFIIFHAAAVILPMKLGLRHWRKIDF